MYLYPTHIPLENTQGALKHITSWYPTMNSLPYQLLTTRKICIINADINAFTCNIFVLLHLCDYISKTHYFHKSINDKSTTVFSLRPLPARVQDNFIIFCIHSFLSLILWPFTVIGKCMTCFVRISFCWNKHSFLHRIILPVVFGWQSTIFSSLRIILQPTNVKQRNMVIIIWLMQSQTTLHWSAQKPNQISTVAEKT